MLFICFWKVFQACCFHRFMSCRQVYACVANRQDSFCVSTYNAIAFLVHRHVSDCRSFAEGWHAVNRSHKIRNGNRGFFLLNVLIMIL